VRSAFVVALFALLSLAAPAAARPATAHVASPRLATAHLATAHLPAAPWGAARPLALVPIHPAPEARPRRTLLDPLPFFWRELDAQRVNRGLVGRKNATRDEQRVAETPSLRPRPLSSY
jgi:hypothetical protein